MQLRNDVINQTNLATLAGGGTINTGNSGTDAGNTNATTDAFSTFLKSKLEVDQNGNVNEKQLFSALVEQRIQKLQGDAGVKIFESRLADSKKEYRSLESATKWALMQMEQHNEISYEDGNKIHAEAFDAAQLDNNKDALFDSTGGPNDPTIAVASLEKAIVSAHTLMDQFDAGTKTPVTRPVSVIDTGEVFAQSLKSSSRSGQKTSSASSTSSGTVSATSVSAAPVNGIIKPRGTVMDGAGGFLFKPVGDNDGKLAVLSPDYVGPLVQSISLKDSNGNVIEQGRFTSFGDDGKTRAKYSFRKPGGQYPKNMTVEIKYLDGTTGDYQIPDPSKRYD